MGVDASDRRRWPRYVPIERRARLGWWKAGAFRTTTARLANVGRGGAVVEADALPPEGTPAWIHLVEPGEGGWVEAEIRPAMIRPRGPHRLRLIFRDPSSTEAFVKEAAFGGHRAAADASADAMRMLGLAWPCSADQVRLAYRRLALREHPDRGGTQEGFIRLQFAYKAMLAQCSKAPANGRAASP